jgi:hypothetical protein
MQGAEFNQDELQLEVLTTSRTFDEAPKSLRSSRAVALHLAEEFCSLVDAPNSFRQTVSGGA